VLVNVPYRNHKKDRFSAARTAHNDSPFSLWATPVGQTAHKLEQARVQPTNNTMLGQQLAVDAIDGEMREVAAGSCVHGGDDARGVLSVDVLEESQAPIVFLGGGEWRAKRAVAC